MRRRAGVVIGIAAVAAALVVWRSAGGRGAAAPARGSLAGTITGPARAAIPGARVCAFGRSRELPTEALRDPRCTSADPQGRYRLDDLLPAIYIVSATAPRFRPAVHHPDGARHRRELHVSPGEARAGVDLELTPGGVEITGTVSDVAGRPVTGARVWARSGLRAGDPVVHVEADAQGAYTAWVAPGAVVVSASAKGHARTAHQTGRAPGRYDLLLAPESSIAGIVVDAGTGRPISGARVTATPGGVSGGERVLSDEQGRFRIARLPPDRHLVVARTERGHGQTEGSIPVGLDHHVDGVVVKLHPAVRVEARVVIAATGAVCPDGTAALIAPGRDGAWSPMQRAPDGTLSADGVVPGTYEVAPGCSGHVARDRYPVVVVADRDVTGLVWEVDAGSTVRGTVRGPSGAPIEGARLDLYAVGDAPPARGAPPSGTSAADGRYELVGVEPGAYELVVTSDRALAADGGYPVAVPAGAVTRDVVLEDGGTIRGTVVDTDGRPVRGVVVVAHATCGGTMWPDAPSRTDDTGAFTLDAVRPGEYRVAAARGFDWPLRTPGADEDGERVTVRASQVATVRLVVERETGAITGTVTDAAGAPVAGAVVSAVREPDRGGVGRGNLVWHHRPVVTSTDGAFTVAGLASGRYTVRADRRGGGAAVAEHVPVGGSIVLAAP